MIILMVMEYDLMIEGSQFVVASDFVCKEMHFYWSCAQIYPDAELFWECRVMPILKWTMRWVEESKSIAITRLNFRGLIHSIMISTSLIICVAVTRLNSLGQRMGGSSTQLQAMSTLRAEEMVSYSWKLPMYFRRRLQNHYYLQETS